MCYIFYFFIFLFIYIYIYLITPSQLTWEIRSLSASGRFLSPRYIHRTHCSRSLNAASIRLRWMLPCSRRTMFKNVFGSGFLVRTAHVILTWVITLILFLHDTGEFQHFQSLCLFQSYANRRARDTRARARRHASNQITDYSLESIPIAPLTVSLVIKLWINLFKRKIQYTTITQCFVVNFIYLRILLFQIEFFCFLFPLFVFAVFSFCKCHHPTSFGASHLNVDEWHTSPICNIVFGILFCFVFLNTDILWIIRHCSLQKI